MYLTNERKYLLLLEISRKVRDTLDLDETLDHLLDTINTVVDYDAAGIFVLNQDIVHRRHEQPREVIAGIARRGFDKKQPDQDDMLTFGRGIVGHVIFNCTSMVIPDVHQDARYVEGRSRTQSEIAVPIMRNNRAVGALNLESDQLSAYDESHLEVLQFFADVAAISIEKAMLHRQLLEKKLIDKQLQLAREVQMRLFPHQPVHLAGFDIAGICLPAEEIGGDYFDYINLPGGGLGVAVADVSGNGIASALVMTAFRGLLRMRTHGRLEPSKIFSSINRSLPEFTSYSHFVTAVYAVLKPCRDELTYICCGQQPPLLVRANGNLDMLTAYGPALGILRKISPRSENISLAAGDILAIYTDGVVELSNDQGIDFGIERLALALNKGRDLSAGELVEQIIATTRQFSGSPSYPDDFTLVIIKRL